MRNKQDQSPNNSKSMLRQLLFILSLLLTGAQVTCAQNSSPLTFPFRLTSDNNISIKAILNDRDTLDLMFHTASSSLTLTEDATKRMKNIVFERTDTVRSWGGNANASRYSKDNTLRIGDKKWNNLRIWENTNSGPETDGKFGLDFFADQAVEIDFDKKVIVIHPQLPRKIKKYQRLDLAFVHDMMFADGKLKIGDSTITNRFLIHSGYSGTILVDDKFAADHQLISRLPVVAEQVLKDSFGNKLKTSKAVLPIFSFGNSEFFSIPISFFSGAIGRQKMSIVGGDLLKRFNLIIAKDRKSIYLKASKFRETEYWKG